jgi:NADPH2:quinone reductase
MPSNEMRAVALERFGGLETLTARTIPIPKVKPDQVLIRVRSAGVGVWDVAEREGLVTQMLGIKASFPFVLGTEGAGEVVEVGEKVRELQSGDTVYGLTWGTDPKAGFYAEYTAVSAERTFRVPSRLPVEQAGPLAIDGAVALRGLDEILGLKRGETLMVFGASGGIGHMAVQLAAQLGARVFAIASGQDGVALALHLGAEGAVDGHDADMMVASARKFAPEGFDTALLTATGEAADRALTTMRDGGRVAHPFMRGPEAKAPAAVRVQVYMESDYWDQAARPLFDKLNQLIEAGTFEVHLGGTFTLDQAADAHRSLGSHYLGKLALLPGS